MSSVWVSTSISGLLQPCRLNFLNVRFVPNPALLTGILNGSYREAVVQIQIDYYGFVPKRKLILVFMFSHSQILGEQSISYCEFEHCGHRRRQRSIVWTYVLHK